MMPMFWLVNSKQLNLKGKEVYLVRNELHAKLWKYI